MSATSDYIKRALRYLLPIDISTGRVLVDKYRHHARKIVVNFHHFCCVPAGSFLATCQLSTCGLELPQVRLNPPISQLTIRLLALRACQHERGRRNILGRRSYMG